VAVRAEIHPPGPARDLSQDEAAGGHILRKHVGQTDEQLRQRLDREPRITGASTYTDRQAAEQAVGAAIATSQDRIQRWLGRSGGHPNLVLDYESEGPIGRTINRGENQSRPCAHALVVLKYSGPNQYYVLTSYPECR
jgi:DNA-binding transcriptional LysR family regulator